MTPAAWELMMNKDVYKTLLHARIYGPNRATGTRWNVIKRTRTPTDLHLLCRSGQDYVVFSFWLPSLSTRSIPSDKFTHGRASGLALFHDIVADHTPPASRLKTHGLRRGTAQTPCGVRVSFLSDGTDIRVDEPNQPKILLTHNRRQVTCQRCKLSKSRLTKRDDR